MLSVYQVSTPSDVEGGSLSGNRALEFVTQLGVRSYLPTRQRTLLGSVVTVQWKVKK